MPRHAAKNVCRPRGAVAAVLLAACAGSGPEPVVRSVPLADAQLQLCRDVEQAYRRQDPDYETLRDRAAADPATAVWLTRMFVRDVFAWREGRSLGEDQGLLRAAAQVDDELEARAIAELEVLGVRAVPTLVGDLLSHGQPQTRQVGVELLARIGAPALPAVCELARHGDPRLRRAAGRALGAIGVDDASLPTLRALATEREFTVRADALRELHDGGAPVRDLLLERLRDDDDPFVRRTAAEALRHFPGRPSALGLVDYLARCKRDGDFRGEQTAQASLQVLAAANGPRTEAAWRRWAETLRGD